MQIQKIVQLATPGSSSPAVYETARGTLVIQGYQVQNNSVEGVEGFLPERECLVEIPEELLALYRNRKAT